MKAARDTLTAGHFNPLHTSELASELATSEMRSGRSRQARKFMRMAIEVPTENALAQAEWGNSHGIVIELERSGSALRAYEADARGSMDVGKFTDALGASQSWQADQPFATDAAVFTSYVATLAEDWSAGVAAARQGLIVAPNDVYLRNNLIFNAANNGDVETVAADAPKLERLAGADKSLIAMAQATYGLVEFRSDRALEGRKLYERAIETFRLLREPKERSACTCIIGS